MAAIAFLQIETPGPRADEIIKLLSSRASSVSYATEMGAGRIEVYFNSAQLDADQAREDLERALDASGEDARDHVTVVYPDSDEAKS